MNLQKFLTYFLRVQAAEPDKTVLRFAVNDAEFLAVQAVSFDAEANAWTVRLAKNSA